MKISQYIYNNEAISVIALIAVLEELIEIELTKTMLILPFLYHKRTLDFLEQNNIDNFSIEVLSDKNILLSNFNERFLTYLPIAINSLSILLEIQVIQIVGSRVIYNTENNFDIRVNSLGERAKQIISVAKKLSPLLRNETKILYKHLRVAL